jgi:hypothetical protein
MKNFDAEERKFLSELDEGANIHVFQEENT